MEPDEHFNRYNARFRLALLITDLERRQHFQLARDLSELLSNREVTHSQYVRLSDAAEDIVLASRRDIISS